MTSKKRLSKIAKKNLELRKSLWPDVSDEDLWDRNTKDGFTTIPRTMPLIQLIMNSLSSGKPVGQTYFALWCYNWDLSFIAIANPKMMAFETGFSGQRAETTWTGRMRILEELGFIESRAGAAGEFHYVLIYNPYLVVKKLVDSKKIKRDSTEYTALIQRAIDIGAAQDLAD